MRCWKKRRSGNILWRNKNQKNCCLQVLVKKFGVITKKSLSQFLLETWTTRLFLVSAIRSNSNKKIQHRVAAQILFLFLSVRFPSNRLSNASCQHLWVLFDGSSNNQWNSRIISLFMLNQHTVGPARWWDVTTRLLNISIWYGETMKGLLILYSIAQFY